MVLRVNFQTEILQSFLQTKLLAIQKEIIRNQCTFGTFLLRFTKKVEQNGPSRQVFQQMCLKKLAPEDITD